MGFKFRSLLITMLLVNTSLAKAAPMTEFYPLQVGDDYSFSASGGGVTTTRVKSTSRIAGTKAVGDTTTNPTNFYFTNDGSGLRIHGLDAPQLGNFNVNPPIVVAPANPVPGTSTVFQSGSVTGTAFCGVARDTPTSINISYSASHRIISEQTNQVIRGAQYPETLTTNFTLSVSGSVPAICGSFISQQISNETNTYARYFGPVRSVVSLPTLSDTFEVVGTNVAVIQLVTDTLSVNEDAGTVSVGVRKFGSFVGDMSVQCFTDPAGASATVVDDYTAQNTLVEFSNGTGFSVVPCTVPIINDRQVEGDETFGVSISNANSVVAARIAGIEDAVVTITDNDPESAPTQDFNGDATSDILFRNTGSGQIVTWFINNGLRSSAVTTGAPSTSYGIVGAGDFNNDGTQDILFRHTTSGQLVIWHITNGTRSSTTVPGAPSTAFVVAGIGDYNADGTDDILFRHSSTGQIVMWHLTNGLRTSSSVPGAPSTAYAIVGTDDFNNDGTDDILFRHTTNGQLVIWHITNGARSSSTVPGAPSTLFSVDGTGDFNNDGTDDILFRHSSTGQVVIWQLTNGLRTSSSVPGAPNTAYVVEGTGDYNGDGTSDILFRHNSNGQVVFWMITNGTRSSATVPGGPPTVWAVQ